jgi:hypothetical protein
MNSKCSVETCSELGEVKVSEQYDKHLQNKIIPAWWQGSVCGSHWRGKGKDYRLELNTRTFELEVKPLFLA